MRDQMINNGEYTLDEMLNWLTKYYENKCYETEHYSDKFLPARVPLHCIKKECEKSDEIVIEITTDAIITKDGFFPLISVEDKVKIPDASPVRFYQYYFPKARIFYAHPDYVKKNDGYNEFKKVCEARGIGILKTSEKKIEKVIDASSLFDQICKKLIDSKDENNSIKNIIGEHFENYLHCLVYYPDPIYNRRAITRRKKEDIRISLMLLKKLQQLNKIKYHDELIELTSNYLMKEVRDDYNIAADYVDNLWKNYLGLKYPNPNIQVKFEEIFLKEYGYREHFVHQFQVFLLGSYIIDKLCAIRKDTIKKFKDTFRTDIEIAWLAASTYHDFNYSTQKYQSWLIEYLNEVLRLESKKVKKELSKLNLEGATIRENFLLTSEKLLDIIINKYVDKPEPIRDKLNLFLYEKIVSKRNHGLLGSLTLLKIYNDAHKKSSNKITKEGIDQAALAIALHDEKMWEFFCGCKGYLLEEKECKNKCEKKNNCDPWDKNLKYFEILDKISFNDEPLIYLLILCDSVQDEGRVGQESSNIRSYLTGLEVDSKGKLQITVVVSDSFSYRIKQSEFSRLEQFLCDGQFEIILKPNNSSCGKEKSFTL